MEKLLQRSAAAPRKLFLVDAAGALLSAFLLGIVLVAYQPVFGMPVDALYYLAAIPCFFILYDLGVAIFAKSNLSRLLKGIALANFAYCLVSLAFFISHFSQLTPLGIAYFLGEIALVMALVVFEWKVAGRLAGPVS